MEDIVISMYISTNDIQYERIYNILQFEKQNVSYTYFNYSLVILIHINNLFFFKKNVWVLFH